MSCEGCAAAAADKNSGLVIYDCLECRARSLAGSPAFFDSVRADAILPTYRSALRHFFPNESIADAHARVKRYA